MPKCTDCIAGIALVPYLPIKVMESGVSNAVKIYFDVETNFATNMGIDPKTVDEKLGEKIKFFNYCPVCGFKIEQ